MLKVLGARQVNLLHMGTEIESNTRIIYVTRKMILGSYHQGGQTIVLIASENASCTGYISS